MIGFFFLGRRHFCSNSLRAVGADYICCHRAIASNHLEIDSAPIHICLWTTSSFSAIHNDSWLGIGRGHAETARNI